MYRMIGLLCGFFLLPFSKVLADPLIIKLPDAVTDSEKALLYPQDKIPGYESFQEMLSLSWAGYQSEWATIRSRHGGDQAQPDLREEPFWSRLTLPVFSENAKALFVFLHGLNSHPSVWEPYLSQLTESQRYDLWAPFIPEKGNIPLLDTIPDLFENLEEYLAKDAERPVVLIGASNGARVALMLECLLRNRAGKVFVASLAGVHGGTSRIRFRYYWTHPELYSELSYGSQASERFISLARARIPEHAVRAFTFYGSPEDSQVVPVHATFPLLGHGESFFLVRGVNHRSLTGAVQEHVLLQAEDWLATL